ncbi:MAG TPA: nitrate reductase associated protein [bacterium]|nr:nitrate reductase associated protein [bacterium]
MFRQFKFEEPLYQKLDQLPVSTRFKLETLGFQFPLEAWNQLALPERWVFCHLPIRSKGERECYSGYLAYVLKRHGITISSEGAASEKKGWEDLSRLPSEVALKMRDLNLPLFWPEWIKLDDMERFTVYKFCRENAGDALIQQVVQEFLGLSTLPTPAS